MMTPEEIYNYSEEKGILQKLSRLDQGGRGYYGGDQGGPLRLWQLGNAVDRDMIRRVVRKNDRFRDLSEEHLVSLLKRLKTEGCGYTALMNTVFLDYWDRPDTYREIFGFPMFQGEKPLYSYLILDFYAATDNMYYAEDGAFEFPYEDYSPGKDGPIFRYDPRADETGNGTEQYQRRTRFLHYMREHGLEASYETRGVLSLFGKRATPQECLRRMENGEYVILTVKSPRKGQPLADAGEGEYLLQGEHVMLITGVESGERLCVSSWGRKYYIDYPSIANRSYVEFMRV